MHAEVHAAHRARKEGMVDMAMEMTRKAFVGGSVCAAVGLAAIAQSPVAARAAEGAREPVADALAANVNVLDEMEPADETHEADVVVLGAGPAGIACATRAAELGAKVAVVEKRDCVGGTGLFASGNCYIALNSEYQAQQGLEADVPAFYKEWLEAVHYHCDQEVLGTYLRNCGRVADWLIGYGFEFYMKEVPATNGLSGNEYRISQPARDSGIRETAYGAMMDVVTAAGGEVVYGTTAQELIVDGEGAVVGVRCVNDAGATVDFTGKAVVVACGGYGANQDMVNALCNPPLVARDPVLNMGEGARMAWAAGAKKPWNLGILCCDSLYPIDASYKSYSGGVQGLGNVMGDFGKARLHVSQEGRRYHSEDAFCWVPTYGGANAVSDAQPWLFVIADQAVMDEFMGQENATLDEAGLEESIANGVAYKGETLAELAQAAGMDPETLEATVAEYNGFCAAGEDPVFYKKADYLVALAEQGPYYAVRFAPTPFGSCGDLAVNAQCQVRAEQGGFVPGLYAAGTECVGVMHNDTYWALGQTVGWAHTSGVLAAEDICANVL